MSTLILSTSMVKSYKKHYGRDAECSICNKKLNLGDEIYKTRKKMYCIPCSNILYIQTEEEPTDQEVDEFFTTVQ